MVAAAAFPTSLFDIQHSIITWISSNLTTGVWYYDIALVMIASMVLSWLVALISRPREILQTFFSPLYNYFFSDKQKYSLSVDYNTTLNKWGDICTVDCSEDNQHLLTAIFSYVENQGKLEVAKIDVGSAKEVYSYESGFNLYKNMKEKLLKLKPVSCKIKFNKDVKLIVDTFVEESKANNRITKMNITITSNKSFETCSEFAKKCYDYYIEREYKKYDETDKDLELRYYSIRSIDHETGNMVHNQYKLGTSRTFDYLFFDEKDKILKLVDNFLSDDDHFKKGGVACKLGFLLYGKPGCGKTSFIKALANYSKRHIFDLHLSKFLKNSELRDAFFQEEITYSTTGGSTSTVRIPLDKRIIIMEDIDALSEVVMKRSANVSYSKDVHKKDKKKTPSNNDNENEDDTEDTEKAGDDNGEKKKEGPTNEGGQGPNDGPPAPDDVDLEMMAWKKFVEKKERLKDRLNLGALLSILDGTLELTGPIVIMTTNHPEKLDPALIRSGRVSRQVYFGDLGLKSFREMLVFFYTEEVVDEYINKYLPNWELQMDKVIPPNDLEQICRNNVEFKEACKEIIEYVFGEQPVIRIDDVRVSQDCQIETVKRSSDRVIWRTATFG